MFIIKSIRIKNIQINTYVFTNIYTYINKIIDFLIYGNISYPGVPIRSLEGLFEVFVSIKAKPRSVTLRIKSLLLFIVFTISNSGLISRWITPLECRNCTALYVVEIKLTVDHI